MGTLWEGMDRREQALKTKINQLQDALDAADDKNTMLGMDLLLAQEHTEQIKQMLHVYEKGYLTPVEPNHRYCSECGAITPHEPPSNPFGSMVCKVCGDGSYMEDDACPHCGWVVPEEIPQKRVTAHNPSCHCAPPNQDELTQEEFHELYGIYAWNGRKWVDKVLNDFSPSWMRKCRQECIGKSDVERSQIHRRYHRRLNEAKKMTCTCPEYTINSTPYLLAHEAWTDWEGEYSGWSRIRCPICGKIYEVNY